MCSEMVKNIPKCAKCALPMGLLGVAMATLDACRINEVLVLVFNRGDIWLFQRIVFSPKFKNLFF